MKSLRHFMVAPILLLAADAFAQTPLGKLEPGNTVRVSTVDGLTREARVVSLEPDTLVLNLNGEGRFAVADIDKLWVRGRATATGAILGAAIGGALSFGFWASFCTAMNESASGGCDEWGTVTLLGLAGAAGGGIVGALIGSAVPKWRLRYADGGTTAELIVDPVIGFSVPARSKL